ncbi:MAG: GntR family transcriptional regulator [Proteobacteria bacterium]|nr:GntR family transcriptional regulator [Pseudomonadota bacterium]MBU4597092.1 GntR family transcriptional regulator [Pseudomonadota bacterium]MBV1715334.1 GntR family transcriptional regulator [Desulfarculus sp.]
MSVELTKVLKGLRYEIYSGLRLPRERLVETELAEAYSVSRMMIRRALNQLTQEGLVRLEPYRGASVAEISLANIHEKYHIAAMLEGYAAKLATKRLNSEDLEALAQNLEQQKQLQVEDVQQWQGCNRQFHRLLNYKCGSARLVEMIKENARFTSYWFIVLSAPGRISANIGEHEQILRALRRGENEEARHMVERHLLKAAEYLVNFLKKNIPIGLWREGP